MSRPTPEAAAAPAPPAAAEAAAAPARPAAAAVAGPDDFSAAIDDFARAWRRARTRLRHDEGLSIAQYHLLEPLVDAPGALPVGRLAAHAGIAAPTATRMLDALVRDGLCERERDADDRRCVKVSLTPAGRTAAAERRARMDERRARIYAALTPDERRDAARLLQRLAAAIEELRS
ncbi:MAG TPA: MarR family transcriptional regulator [Solirubrobacteraceae bacterium]|nr:MarR family transcriptional regulator [Solirubrobacteraceae bacterium]HSD80742.1 MarR family transcriptional regulator [Solirubrobacteraceae bacterium]